MKPYFHLATNWFCLWLFCPRDPRVQPSLFQFAFCLSDTGTAFIPAHEEHLPHVAVVFDHHRIPSMMNKGFEIYEGLNNTNWTRMEKRFSNVGVELGVRGTQTKVLLGNSQHC
jgi:hypothetical protein